MMTVTLSAVLMAFASLHINPAGPSMRHEQRQRRQQRHQRYTSVNAHHFIYCILLLVCFAVFFSVHRNRCNYRLYLPTFLSVLRSAFNRPVCTLGLCIMKQYVIVRIVRSILNTPSFRFPSIMCAVNGAYLSYSRLQRIAAAQLHSFQTLSQLSGLLFFASFLFV